jgi:drug/metabolite transporter (DMT)-like permease
MESRRVAGLALASASGVLYGSINVLAKPIGLHPLAKATVAYLASALLLSPWLRRIRVVRGDWPKVLAMGLIGGGLAPVLLFTGLQETAAADAGMLLTLEMVATATLAFLFLGERFAGREVAGLALLLAAAALVAVASPAEGTGGSTVRGVLLVLGSAVGWGVDNAVSARLAGSYPLRGLIALKGLLGGTACLLASLLLRVPVPDLPNAAAMAGLGVLSIAVSSLCFYNALRLVGASRTSAMNIAFTALVGAAGGALLLGERLAWLHAAALGAVLGGSALLAKPAARAAIGAPGPG